MDFLDLENFKKFLSFKSISSDPRYSEDVKQCADWLSTYLRDFCAEVHLIQTDVHPVVIGKVGSGEPLVIYGHYDVQPADFADGWSADPFNPTFVNGRLYARGAQDNKGQLWYCIQAVKNLVHSNKLSRRVIFFIEGEEESAGLGGRRLLRSDGNRIVENSKTVLIPDAGALSEGVECITVGLRGSASFTVLVRGPENDLHSGIFGGLVPNPIFDAAKIISSLDSQFYGEIPGFLDGYQQPSVTELECNEAILNLVDESLSLGRADSTKAQVDRNILNLGLFPRIEICGVGGGYFGDGFKNIIPSSVKLKISLRLAYNQSSSKALEAVVNHITRLPLVCKLDIESQSVGSNPIKVPTNDSSVEWLKSSLKKVTGNPVAFQWWGASIPIVQDFVDLGLTPLIFGFGLPEDNIHGPNESFSASQWQKGLDLLQVMLSS